MLRLRPTPWGVECGGVGDAGGCVGGGAAAPPTFRRTEWREMVQRCLSQREAQMERTGDRMVFGVAPAFITGGDAYALSAWAEGGIPGLGSARQDVLRRSAMLAAELAHFIQIFPPVRAAGAAGERPRNSARVFRSKQSAEGLGQGVCRDALQITSGARAALLNGMRRRVAA